jgi:glycolate oxidase iron-sulfur subunit
MRAVSEGRLPLSEGVVLHLDRCLGCRACEPICPSGVPFGRMLEAMRAVIARQHPTPGWHGRLERFAFRAVLPSRRVVGLLVALLRFAEASGLRRLLRPWLPPALRPLEALAPVQLAPPYHPQPFLPALGPERGQVLFFLGCVMPALFGEVHRASEELLRRAGFAVITPPAQTCCGALMAHAGQRELARALAQRNLTALAGDAPIIVNAAGCGAMLKEYGELLADEPHLAAAARQVASRVQDISEFLAAVGLPQPLGPVPVTVTYQDACHLAHAQGIRREPRALLRQVPGLQLVELPASDRCCGSAGIYNLTHPLLAGELLERKVDDILTTRASLVAVGNPGCLLQLQAGLRQRKVPLRAVHPVSLLVEACRRGADLAATSP